MTKREKELEDLFQRWMKKQGEEKGWEKTTVGGREILRIHFTKDGMGILKLMKFLLVKFWSYLRKLILRIIKRKNG